VPALPRTLPHAEAPEANGQLTNGSRGVGWMRWLSTSYRDNGSSSSAMHDYGAPDRHAASRPAHEAANR
jgi:hypothetical protein